MARADLLCDIIKYGLNSDSNNFRRAAEAICAEERSKQHVVLASKIEELLKNTSRANIKETNAPSVQVQRMPLHYTELRRWSLRAKMLYF